MGASGRNKHSAVTVQFESPSSRRDVESRDKRGAAKRGCRARARVVAGCLCVFWGGVGFCGMRLQNCLPFGGRGGFGEGREWSQMGPGCLIFLAATCQGRNGGMRQRRGVGDFGGSRRQGGVWKDREGRVGVLTGSDAVMRALLGGLGGRGKRRGVRKFGFLPFSFASVAHTTGFLLLLFL